MFLRPQIVVLVLNVLKLTFACRTYFKTSIFLAVAACTSMLSTPAPALPITFSLVAAFMTSALTFVSERTMSPS